MLKGRANYNYMISIKHQPYKFFEYVAMYRMRLIVENF